MNFLRFYGWQANTRPTSSKTHSYPTCVLYIRRGPPQGTIPPSTTSALGILSLTRTRCLICSANVRWILLCHLHFTRRVWQESNLSPAPTLPSNFPPSLCPKQSGDSTHSKNGNGGLPGGSCYSTANLTHQGNVDRLISPRWTLGCPCRMFCVPSVEGLEYQLGVSCACLIFPTETIVWIACWGGTTSSSR